jgi:hypothetical protein
MNLMLLQVDLYCSAVCESLGLPLPSKLTCGKIMKFGNCWGWGGGSCQGPNAMAPCLVGRDERGIWHMDAVRRMTCVDVNVLRSITDRLCTVSLR